MRQACLSDPVLKCEKTLDARELANSAMAEACSTDDGLHERREPAQGIWAARCKQDRAMTKTLQLLAANLEEADPTVFGILQKVYRLIVALRSNHGNMTTEIENRRKCGRSIS